MRVYGITYRRYVNGQLEPLDHSANIGGENYAEAAKSLREGIRQDVEISRIVPIAVVHFIQPA